MKKTITIITLLVCFVSLLYPRPISSFGYEDWKRYSPREKEMIVFGFLLGVVGIQYFITNNGFDVDLSQFTYRGMNVRDIVKMIDIMYASGSRFPLYFILTLYIRRT
jgi:hypothetical protein